MQRPAIGSKASSNEGIRKLELLCLEKEMTEMTEICKVRIGKEQVPRNQLLIVPSNTRIREHHRRQRDGMKKAR